MRSNCFEKKREVWVKFEARRVVSFRFLFLYLDSIILHCRARMDRRKRETKKLVTRGEIRARVRMEKTKIRAALTSTIRETRYFALNFTNSNVIQTCHDRDWVKLNKKLDTRSNFTKFHTVHDRNEWKLHEKENQYLFDRAKYRGRKFAQETTLTKIHIKIIIIYRKL